MHIDLQQGGIQDSDADAIIVNLFQGVTQPSGGTGAVDEALEFAITDLIAQGNIEGKLGETLVVFPLYKIPAKRVIIVGLGPADTFNEEGIREAAGAAIKKAREMGAKSVATILHGAGIGGQDPTKAAQALVEGSLLALYRYEKPGVISASAPSKEIESLTIVEFDQAKHDQIREGIGHGEGIVAGVIRARTLTNQPSNVATPSAIAASALEVAENKSLICSVYDEDWKAQESMKLELAVTPGATEPAQFIVMEHRPEGTDESDASPIILLGKGVAFDTGGYSLKSGAGMLGMKGDMGGAAAVIGAMEAIARLDLPIYVMGIVPTVENVISATSYKPNDVFVARNGVSVEIISTDAEGRLIMADALSYAADFNPRLVIDAATLTGGKMVALGHRTQALFGTDDFFCEQIIASGATAGAPLWRMPLDKRYDQQLKSDVADIKNSGGRMASAVTAARFLAHFVGDHPWVHIDIAGAELYKGSPDENKRSYLTKGGTGVMVRTFVEFVRRQAM
ncbi:MAG: leucyl aminopeptidase [Chloroflexota bacterium]